MLNPPITGIQELDAYLSQLAIDLDGLGTTATTVTPDAGAGEPVGYSLQYLHIKYATDSIGTGFSNSPSGMTYFGTYNSSTGVESTNPTDYTWFNTIGFGGANYLYYTPLGGRQIKFAVAAAAPSYKWLIDPGTAIDIDNIVPAATVNTQEIAVEAVTHNANSGVISSVFYPTAGSSNTGLQTTSTFTYTGVAGNRAIINFNINLDFGSFTSGVAAFTYYGTPIRNGVALSTPAIAFTIPIAYITGSSNRTVAVTTMMSIDVVLATSGDTFGIEWSAYPRDSTGAGLLFSAGDNIDVISNIVVQELKR